MHMHTNKLSALPHCTIAAAQLVNLCTHTHTHKHTHTHAHTHTHTDTNTHTYTHTHTPNNKHTYAHSCMYTHTRTHPHSHKTKKKEGEGGRRGEIHLKCVCFGILADLSPEPPPPGEERENLETPNHVVKTT